MFENGGRLYLLNLATEKYREVEHPGAHRPRHAQAARWRMCPRSAQRRRTFRPSGKRAVFEARGEIFTVPAEHGVVRNLTRSSGVAERYPAWSPGRQKDRLFQRPLRGIRTDDAPCRRRRARSRC